VALAAGSVAAGLASRRVETATSRRGLVILGVAGMATGAVALGAAPSLPATIAASLLMGLAGTLTLVGAQAALADQHADRRAVALSEGNVAASLGALGVPLVVGAGEAIGLGWRLALGAGAAAGALLAWRVRASGIHEPAVVAGRDGGGPLPDRARVGLVLIFCAVCAEWSVSFWGATFADDVVGLSTDAAVALSSAFFGAMLAGRLVGGALARRVSAERVVAGALAVAVGGFPVLWLAQGIASAGTGLILVGLGIGSLFPMCAAITFAAAPGLTTLVSGRAVTAGSTAMLLAPLALGQIADAGGLRVAFGLVPVFLALAATTLAVLARTPHPAPATATA
jgi:MFS family permease